jgi:hypothetical protein
MPRPKRDLSPLRDIIITAYRKQTSVSDIVALLKDKFDLVITYLHNEWRSITSGALFSYLNNFV